MRLSNINFENPDKIRVALVFTYNINVRKIKGKYHIDTFKPRRNRTDFLYTMIDKMVFRETAKMIYKLQRNIRAATFLLIMTKTGWVYSIAFCSVLDKYDRKQGIREALKKLKIYDNLPWKDKGEDYIIDNYLERKPRPKLDVASDLSRIIDQQISNKKQKEALTLIINNYLKHHKIIGI